MTPHQIAELLREFGAAIRGDWGQIDGRSIMHGMNTAADLIDTNEPALAKRLETVRLAKETAKRWPQQPTTLLALARDALDLCPHGHGHWTQYCLELDKPTADIPQPAPPNPPH